MRLHILSAKPGIGTGYSTVVQNLAVELKKLGHDIAITGFQQAYRMDEYKGIPVYPLLDDFHSAGNIYSQIHVLVQNLKSHQSDALFCLFQGDSMFNPFIEVHPNTIWYLPIEGEIVYKYHPTFNAAQKVKRVISMTHSARAQLDNHGIKNTTIYHGYNPKIFKPHSNKNLEDPILFYFPENNNELRLPANVLHQLKTKMGWDFVIGFNGLNFGVRKRIERLIAAFAQFSKDKKNVHLHLHTPPIHNKGIDLLEISDYYDVNDKVSFSYGDGGVSSVSDDAMNSLYNMFDVFATASSGEGAGLAHFESMACGLPQIAPDIDPFREYSGHDEEKRCLLAKSMPQMTVAGELRGLVDINSLAEKIEIMYIDEPLRKTLSENCKTWVQQFEWPKIAKQFDKLLKEMVI